MPVQAIAAQCVRLELLGHGRVRAWLRSSVRPQPGQCMLARLGTGPEPYLRSVLFPVAFEPELWAIELAPGESGRDWLQPGSSLELLGPVGRPAALPAAKGNLLLIANTQPARLLPFAAATLAAGGAALLLLARPYPVESLDARIEVRIGHLPALVREHSAWPALAIAHVEPQPAPELAALLAQIPNAHVLLHLCLPCGVGACQACTIRTRAGWKLACTAGLLWPLAELQAQP